MEHMAWKGRIKPGCKAEYQKRHTEIWPEMVQVLKDAGICNYSIFYCNDELFGYYECEKGVAYAEKVQAESPVVDRWNEYIQMGLIPSTPQLIITLGVIGAVSLLLAVYLYKKRSE